MNTSTPPPLGPDDATADEWIFHALGELTKSLGTILDVEAGLRDALLTDRVRSLDTALEDVIDVDAGLAAILPVRPSREQAWDEPAPPRSATVQHHAQWLSRRSLRERLTARSRLPTTNLRLVLLLTQASRDAEVVADNVEFVGPSRDARQLANDLLRATENAKALVTDSHSIGLRPIDAERERAAVSSALNDSLTQACGRARAIAEGNHDNSRLTADALRNAQAIADTLADARSNTRFLDRVDDLSRVVARAITLFSHRELATSLTALEGAINDFTNADLSRLDLRDLDLNGVRWSSKTTRWPPNWEDMIQAVSVQPDPDQHPDLYEIHDDTRIRHHLPRL